MSPQRIQRQRTKGWRMPEGAVYVGRPTKWGNPFEAYLCPCCKAWDVRDNNGVTYLASHEFIRLHPRMTIGKAEAVALLPGWVNSRGATLERRIAKALDLQIGPVERFLGGEPS